ncbi:MAG TPA: DUF3122 domain-containing protein [Coleofasciculaceae cyanobacterium]
MNQRVLKRVWQWGAIAALSLLFWWIDLDPLPAAASILRTADASGAIVVQSRRTLRDPTRQSWQVIAFKRVQPSGLDAAVNLRLVGFSNQIEIAHPRPLVLMDIQGHLWTAADISDQISVTSPQPTVGQYQLQGILSELSTHQPLRLEVPIQNGEAIVLRIPPALIQEWQSIAPVDASQLIQACDQFPLEARQNSDFPEWTGCRIAAENSLP